MQFNNLQKINARPVNVLEIIGTATKGGMENYILSFLQNLPADQFKVTCICPCESIFTGALRKCGVEDVFITPLADDPQWRSIQVAMEVAKLKQIDVFHAHMPKSHGLAGIAGSLVGKPVVATLHGMHVTAHELGVALAVKSHLITNCQETYFQALAMGLPEERLNLFHNGVDIHVFNTGRNSKKFRDALGVPEESILIGFVGRLEHEKGPDQFLYTAAFIHNLLPHVHFAVVGDGSMINELKRLGAQLGLAQNLHFVNWLSDTSEAYPAFDLLVHTSRNDGTSLVLLEAMACGLPVAGISVGGVREIIEDAHSGILVEANAVQELGPRIVTLFEQPGRLKSMGEAGRKRVAVHFNVSTNTAKTANLLRDVALRTPEKIAPGDNHDFLSHTNGAAPTKELV